MPNKESSDPSHYEQSGVSHRGGEAALSSLLKHVLPTRQFSPGFPLAVDIGYFANVIDVGQGIGIAFSTDGVGSKVLVAEMMDRYDTIGIDCIAMNVNDIICVGARPVSLVDYIACSSTDERIFGELGKGLAEGARQGGITISGGEISQIREIIQGIDLIGACIGHVPLDRVNVGQAVAPGNLIVGLESTGVHSNGLTLARRALLGETREEQQAAVHKFDSRIDGTLGGELLRPTRIYVAPVMEMLDSGIDLKAMVHITGGGLGNLNRVAADHIRFVIDPVPPRPPVFDLIQDCGEVSSAEMFEVFNMGVGFCLVVEGTREVEAVTAICARHGVPCSVIGQVEAAHGKEVSIPELKLVCQGQSFRSV
ncbi:MAG: phosphoribosylformylglycinamidine cyclo-ligase [Nitrospinae bacterium CG11_big_fil_rev_8_21_14_0_20_56_8]|nr:MAG: phosphoribosylformylglycinamidine cyclo-ligase [Nitrospinae bacterium CG11_big_fil_rev_8_21_14_0_20_56_8]